MTTLFTEHDLIRYIYGESTDTEKYEIENAAVLDTSLQEEILDLEVATTILEKLSFQPSELSLRNIFNFSISFENDQRY